MLASRVQSIALVVESIALVVESTRSTERPHSTCNGIQVVVLVM